MKMMKLNRIVGIALFAIIFSFGSNLYSQNNNLAKAVDTYKENSQKWTNQLNQKVMLSKDQQTKIEQILLDYQKTEAKTNMKNVDQVHATYNSKIESVLNDNQKKLYADYSTQWWKDISRQPVKSAKRNQY